MAALFSDNFNRSNSGTLGANWTTLSGSWSVVSNQAAPGSSGSSAYVNSVNGPANGYIRAVSVVAGAAPDFCGLGYRIDISTFNAYYFGWDTAGGTLYRLDGGAPTAIGATGITPPANGTVVEIQFDGSTHRIYYDGVLQATRTDGTYTAAGRCDVLGAGTSIRIDNFEFGTLSSPGVGASSVAFSATAVGGAIKRAIGAASLAFGSAGAGGALAKAAGVASLTVGATGTGTAKAKAVGSASVAFDAGAAGRVEARGAGAASISTDAAAIGRATAKGAGSAAVTFDGAAAGRSTTKAAGAATIEFLGVGVAAGPRTEGAGAAAVAFSGAATGRSVVRAVGTASFGFGAAGTGSATAAGAGSASVAFDAAGAGAAQTRAAGAAAIAFDAAGNGAALEAGAGVGSAAISFAGAAVGKVVARAVGRGAFVFSADGVSREQGQETDAAGGGTSKPRRHATPAEWLKLNERLNHAAVERAERLRPTRPSRVARTQARIVERAAQIEVIDDSAAEQLRALWLRWYQAELRAGQAAPDAAYDRFTADLAALLAERQMDDEIEEMLILMAVAVLI